MLKLTPSQRITLREMFGGRCAYCGADLPDKGWHADHVESIERKMKYDHGSHRLIPTGKCYKPHNDTVENMFPSCQPCNTHKGPFSLEGWRKELETITGVLQRGYPTYRHAVRFGQVIERPGPIVFWFERYRLEKQACLTSAQPAANLP